MPKADEIIAEAEAGARKVRAKVKPIVQRIEAFRYDPPVVGWKQTGMVVLALLLFAGLMFYAGKKVERLWWRAQIAEKSAAVKSVMQQLDHEAPDLDERLIRTWVADHADQLRKAEGRLADVQRRAATEIEAARRSGTPPPADPVDACRPLPAHCLRN